MREPNDKQKEFARQYLIDLNATQAAIRAGYSARTAEWIGPQLLGKTHVASEIKKLQEERAKRTEITADYVLTTIRDTVERCRQAEPVTEKVDGEMVPTGEYKFDATSVLKGCELLGRHVGIFERDNKQTRPVMVSKVEIVALGGDDE